MVCSHLRAHVLSANYRAKELASKQKDQKQESTGVSKFDYLIGQSEVFAHFLAGESTRYRFACFPLIQLVQRRNTWLLIHHSRQISSRIISGSVATSEKHKKKGSRGKSNRLTEAEEDAQLLATASSSRRTTYLNQQPSNLAKHCKMHPYQLEGLNWMIKLHDHGINGILADEMGLGESLF